VIPSRLAPRLGPELWLDGALATVRSQVGYKEVDWEIYVGISPGSAAPLRFHEVAHVVRAERPGQAAAVNAAADVAGLSSDVLLFLEDDDRWYPKKTEIQLALLDAYPFASCSQTLVDVAGRAAGVNDYPVPSGWAMRSDVWTRVGGFNLNYRWMVDSEWLGKLSSRKIRRTHLIDREPMSGERSRRLGYVHQFSEIVPVGEGLLVLRTDNPEGGMAKVTCDFTAMREADQEAGWLRATFGCDPW